LIPQGVGFGYSPLTKAVAVNTVLRYRAPVISSFSYTVFTVAYANVWMTVCHCLVDGHHVAETRRQYSRFILLW